MNQESNTNRSGVQPRERWILACVLILGMIQGLIYVFLLPPWQHFEEPSHFEYAWLIASRLELPEYPAYDQEKRREIAESMIRHDFFEGMDFLPDLDAKDEPIWIGVNVTGSLPLYPILVAIPLRLFLNANVDFQLYVGRFVSLLLFIATLWLAYQMMCDLVPSGHHLRWVLPIGMALIPGYTDLMTAINNDVGATFGFSLFLWASVRMIVHGYSIKRLVWVVVGAVFCAFTKNTVILAVPLVPVVLFLSLYRPRWMVMGLIGVSVVTIVAIFSVFSWGDAAIWYHRSYQPEVSRIRLSETPVGRFAFRLQVPPESEPTVELHQLLTSDVVQALRGKTVTMGAWIWATTPVQAYHPVIDDGNQTTRQRVDIGPSPSFYAYTTHIAKESKRVEVWLQADAARGSEEDVFIYYDGIVLIDGVMPTNISPVFEGKYGERLTWNERQFTNMVRNGSAERAWPRMQPWVEKVFRRVPWLAHLSPSRLLATALDWKNSSWIFIATLKNVFLTFWARFGWAHIRLSSFWYKAIAVWTGFGIIGAIISTWWIRELKSRQLVLIIVWFGVAFVVIWTMVLLRGFFTLQTDRVYIPSARYGYPVIIPTILVLIIGWRRILAPLGRLRDVIILSGLIILDMVSITRILNYY